MRKTTRFSIPILLKRREHMRFSFLYKISLIDLRITVKLLITCTLSQGRVISGCVISGRAGRRSSFLFHLYSSYTTKHCEARNTLSITTVRCLVLSGCIWPPRSDKEKLKEKISQCKITVGWNFLANGLLADDNAFLQILRGVWLMYVLTFMPSGY